MEKPASPRVVIAVPCLNECEHIATVLAGLAAEAESLDAVVLVLDGGSVDGTRGIVAELARANPHIRLVDNPKRLQACAINLAASMADGADFLIRVDAHCAYPPDYCVKLVAECERIGASSVVVSLASIGSACFQRAVAASQNSRLGNGGSPHRLVAAGSFVNHGHHALFRTSAFLQVGGYDETFTHNEDAELDHRLVKAGHKIWLTGAVAAVYFPRSSLGRLFAQYRNYGRGRMRTLLKHRLRPSARQIVPAGVVPALMLALASPWFWPAILPAAGWMVLCLTYGLGLGIRRGNACEAMSGLVAVIMHAAWSLGFWQGVFEGRKEGRI
ncbi:glycosyltransferase family 2 protein [Mesorhizobium sp. CAU 1741]|uniref:glycosyltransferase family 2 protein n=1 Tax=Mesorhizobium sp. CAU 1741 TaxID=3140366 RepID=UPI00325AAF67